MVSEESLIGYLKQNYQYSDGNLLRSKAYKQWEAGVAVGTIGVRGYMTLSILGKRYYLHRLIWLMHNGVLPPLLDHINGVKADNRIENLRVSNKKENALNLHKPHADNLLGILGVSKRRDTGKYTANLCGVRLGQFDTPEEAERAYINAKLAADERPTA